MTWLGDDFYMILSCQKVKLVSLEMLKVYNKYELGCKEGNNMSLSGGESMNIMKKSIMIW